ncbi:putative quinol monooxygenase [Acidovorax sp. ACV01]|uniref:putative quinol monooxygenase n=1 Tax=Acidovorax sp. ACV01 TaxID=2769311 RepID=UPI001CE0C947|nr:putative quinol monooxygenase [Acidovorax sp. ACV01]
MTHNPEISAVPVIRKLARITGKPQHAVALREALQTLETHTRTEVGCLEFTFFQALSNPDAFVLIETFSSQEALDLHMRLPHTQAFFKAQLVIGVDVESLG